MRNANGERVYLNKNAPPPAFNIQVNDKGERFIVDKKGNRVLVKKDKDGNDYVIGENGQKVVISQAPKENKMRNSLLKE